MARTTTTRESRGDREGRTHALFGSLVAAGAVTTLWILAPHLVATGFWNDHFSSTDPRDPLPFFGAFLVLGLLLTALWPGTWEGELLSRGLRAVAWSILVYWGLAILLDAPTAAGIAILPLLGGPAYHTVRVARRAPRGTVRPYLGALAVLLGALAIVLLGVASMDAATRLMLLPLPVALYLLAPVLLLRTVRDQHEAARREERPDAGRPAVESTFFLDLPEGTLRPPTSTLGLVLTTATILFLVVVVAPGVPLSGPVAWVALTLSVPILLAAVLRKDGVAHPRRIQAPPTARAHHARVAHLKDDELERLDDALKRFVRSGRGRRDLAAALATVLSDSMPHADEQRLHGLLGHLPRAPWRRRAREDAVAHLLGARGLMDSLRHGGEDP